MLWYVVWLDFDFTFASRNHNNTNSQEQYNTRGETGSITGFHFRNFRPSQIIFLISIIQLLFFFSGLCRQQPNFLDGQTIFFSKFMFSGFSTLIAKEGEKRKEKLRKKSV